MGFYFDEQYKQMLSSSYRKMYMNYRGYDFYKLIGNDPEYSKYVATNKKKLFFSPSLSHLKSQIDDGRL